MVLKEGFYKKKKKCLQSEFIVVYQFHVNFIHDQQLYMIDNDVNESY